MAAKKKAAKKKKAKKKTAKKPPVFRREKGWLNRGEMAESLGISVQAFDRWQVQPVAKKHKHGETFFTVADVVENRLNWFEAKLEKAQPNRDASEMMNAKLSAEVEWTEQRAEGQRLQNARTRRELAPVEVITWVASQVGSQISAVLDTIPGKVKRALPDISATSIEIVKREIVKAQNTAAENCKVNLDEFEAEQADAGGD